MLLVGASAMAQPDAAALVRSAITEEAVAVSARVDGAKDEIALLETLPVIEHVSDASSREMLRLDAALKLADTGTSRSLPMLSRWVELTPEVETTIDGCRAPVQVPLFDFQAAALAALQRIRVAEVAASLHRQNGRNVSAWLAALQSSPERDGLVLACRQIDRDTAVGVLHSMAVLPAATRASAAVSELILVADALPKEAVLDAIADVDCERLYDGRGRLSSDTWHQLEPRIARAQGAGSRLRLAKMAGKSLSIQLAGGADGALKAAEASPGDLLGGANDSESARSVALALMLQDSPDSRLALRKLLDAKRLEPSVERKVRAWLVR